MPDGEKILRSWMVYSPESGHLYCFCCRLFVTAITNKVSKFVAGFDKWWKLNPKIEDHETSTGHLECLEKWKTFAVRLKLKTTIDDKTLQACENEKSKWRKILHRLLDLVIFHTKQNLPFRRHREYISSSNRSNFLELTELLAKYDPVMKKHVMNYIGKKVIGGTKSKVHYTYMNPTTQNI